MGPSVDLKELIRKGAVIVDVRTKNEFDAGHIPGSKNIALPLLNGKINDLKKLNQPLITVCASGSRSALAKSMLKSKGLEVYNGGSWVSVKRLVEK